MEIMYFMMCEDQVFVIRSRLRFGNTMSASSSIETQIGDIDDSDSDDEMPTMVPCCKFGSQREALKRVASCRYVWLTHWAYKTRLKTYDLRYRDCKRTKQHRCRSFAKHRQDVRACGTLSELQSLLVHWHQTIHCNRALCCH